MTSHGASLLHHPTPPPPPPLPVKTVALAQPAAHSPLPQPEQPHLPLKTILSLLPSSNIRLYKNCWRIPLTQLYNLLSIVYLQEICKRDFFFINWLSYRKMESGCFVQNDYICSPGIDVFLKRGNKVWGRVTKAANSPRNMIKIRRRRLWQPKHAEVSPRYSPL